MERIFFLFFVTFFTVRSFFTRTSMYLVTMVLIAGAVLNGCNTQENPILGDVTSVGTPNVKIKVNSGNLIADSGHYGIGSDTQAIFDGSLSDGDTMRWTFYFNGNYQYEKHGKTFRKTFPPNPTPLWVKVEAWYANNPNNIGVKYFRLDIDDDPLTSGDLEVDNVSSMYPNGKRIITWNLPEGRVPGGLSDPARVRNYITSRIPNNISNGILTYRDTTYEGRVLFNYKDMVTNNWAASNGSNWKFPYEENMFAWHLQGTSVKYYHQVAWPEPPGTSGDTSFYTGGISFTFSPNNVDIYLNNQSGNCPLNQTPNFTYWTSETGGWIQRNQTIRPTGWGLYDDFSFLELGEDNLLKIRIGYNVNMTTSEFWRAADQALVMYIIQDSAGRFCAYSVNEAVRKGLLDLKKAKDKGLLS